MGPEDREGMGAEHLLWCEETPLFAGSLNHQLALVSLFSNPKWNKDHHTRNHHQNVDRTDPISNDVVFDEERCEKEGDNNSYVMRLGQLSRSKAVEIKRCVAFF